MTTTTLSSNKSSEKLFDRKLFSMMAGCLRQNGILMAMYTVGLLLVTVLPTFYDLRQYTPVNPSESQLFTDSFFYAVTRYYCSGTARCDSLSLSAQQAVGRLLPLDAGFSQQAFSLPLLCRYRIFGRTNYSLPPDLHRDAVLCIQWINVCCQDC